jgi:hypothetical protein
VWPGVFHAPAGRSRGRGRATARGGGGSEVSRPPIRKHRYLVSFDIYLHAFENGRAAERDGAAVRGLLLANADAQEAEHDTVLDEEKWSNDWRLKADRAAPRTVPAGSA